MKLSLYISRYYNGTQKDFAAQQVTSKGNPLPQQQISKWNKKNPEVVLKNGELKIRLATTFDSKDKSALPKITYKSIITPKDGIRDSDLSLLDEKNCPLVIIDEYNFLTHNSQVNMNETPLKEFIKENYGTQNLFAYAQKTKYSDHMAQSYVSKMHKRNATVVEIEGEYYVKTVHLKKIATPNKKK